MCIWTCQRACAEWEVYDNLLFLTELYVLVLYLLILL